MRKLKEEIMTLYEELDAMASAKSQITLKFIKIFHETLQEKIGSNNTLFDLDDFAVTDSMLISKLRMDFNTQDNLLFRHIEVKISIAAISNKTVVMEIGEKRFEIEFDGMNASDSFNAVMDYAVACFKEGIRFTL